MVTLLIVWQLILFGEIVLAQKIMYEKFGNDFLVHFVSKGFPSAHCPQDLTELYCQKLQVILFNFENAPSSWKWGCLQRSQRVTLVGKFRNFVVSFIYFKTFWAGQWHQGIKIMLPVYHWKFETSTKWGFIQIAFREENGLLAVLLRSFGDWFLFTQRCGYLLCALSPFISHNCT